MEGGAGNDLLNGGNGDDDFNGGLGDDMIVGMTGNNHLNGGGGEDTLLQWTDSTARIAQRDNNGETFNKYWEYLNKFYD